MAETRISLFSFERTPVGTNLRTDGFLAGQRFAAARLSPRRAGSASIRLARLSRYQIAQAARTTLVDYAVDRPALHLCLDDRNVVHTWRLAFEEGCLAYAERSAPGRRAG